MNKEFETLLESELLTEEVRTQLTAAVAEFKAAIVETTRNELEVEFAVRREKDNSELTTNVMNTINDLVTAEVTELVSELAHYRNLEVEYAMKLEEFKVEYANKLNEGLSASITSQVESEIAQLREDIVETKKINFGKKIFEAFQSEFSKFGYGGDLAIMSAELEKAKVSLEEANKTINVYDRNKLLDSLLSNLSGSHRSIMATILENVATEKLEARYTEALKTVLKETVSVEVKKVDEGTNDGVTTVVESKETESLMGEDEKARLRNLLGRK